MTALATLLKIIRDLEAIDDAIYRDAHQRDEVADFAYTADELRLSEIIDEARGQAHSMLAKEHGDTHTRRL